MSKDTGDGSKKADTNPAKETKIKKQPIRPDVVDWVVENMRRTLKTKQ